MAMLSCLNHPQFSYDYKDVLYCPLGDVFFYRVKNVMGHLDGRSDFPRLCIGISTDVCC